MTVLQFLLMLIVGAVIVWGVFRALAGDWKALLIGFVVLVVAIWILSALGLTLPTLPSLS